MVHPLTGYMGMRSLQLLFRPAIPSKRLQVWALHFCGVTSSSPWQLRSDLDNWRRSLLIDKCTLWTISPQLTVQAMLEAVQSWIEQWFSASHIFIVPRVLQRDFGHINKDIIFIGHTWDIPVGFVPTIPFVVFYLPSFSRLTCYLAQSSWALDPSPNQRTPNYVKEHVDTLKAIQGM